jgi:hypothetical protein
MKQVQKVIKCVLRYEIEVSLKNSGFSYHYGSISYLFGYEKNRCFFLMGWTPTHWMATWLPFGYMYMHNIAAKYNDTGVTDAITKHDAYVASKTFTPSNITKWVSTIDHAWVGWRNTVTDPEHMSAVELVFFFLLTKKIGKPGLSPLPPHRETSPKRSLTFWRRSLSRTSC